jgi:hypothetical protein
MGKEIMRKKIIGIFIFMLLTTTLLPTTALAGDEENPEITDTVGDARPYLDITKVWFYEDSSTPEMLYTTIEITKPSFIPFKQHLVVTWEMNGEHYASMLAIGYSLLQWFDYEAIIGRGQFGDPKPIRSVIQGSIDSTKGIVTCIIPKSTIGSPEPGDVLTNTHSQCFQRFGFWGRLGFYNAVRYFFFDVMLSKWQLEDTAPDPLNDDWVYGGDYIIQY